MQKLSFNISPKIRYSDITHTHSHTSHYKYNLLNEANEHLIRWMNGHRRMTEKCKSRRITEITTSHFGGG